MNQQIQVYVISLTTSQDRQTRFRERFEKAGADSDSFHWFYAVRNNENPEKGCFDSHNQVLKIAKERNVKYALVFEDDAVFIDKIKWKNVIDTINDFLEKDIKNWKYFSLGYLPVRTRKTEYPNIVEILCAHDAHAYLINVQNVPILTYSGIMFDEQIFCQGIKALDFNNYKYKSNTNVYGAVPMLFKQELRDSSIHNYHLSQGNLIDFYRGENNMLNLSKHVNSIQFILLMLFFIVLVIVLVVLIMLWHFVPEKINKTSFMIWGFFFLLILIIFSIIFGTNYYPTLKFD